MAAVAYTDYYYFVYAAVFATLLCAGTMCRVDVVPRERRASWLNRVLLGAALAVALVAVAVQISGGGVWHLGGLRISLRTGTNAGGQAGVSFVEATGARLSDRDGSRRLYQIDYRSAGDRSCVVLVASSTCVRS